MNLQFLIIDAQNDFADPRGSLFVPGADADGVRLREVLLRRRDDIKALHLSLDAHHLFNIAHPLFWRNREDCPPAPFTRIQAEDIAAGIWRTAHPNFQARALAYVRALATKHRYDLVIWPPHCLIGTWGQNLITPIAEAVWAWEQTHLKAANFIYKGANSWTEHYSALQAEVPDPQDRGTHLNADLLAQLHKADRLIVGGQALSHCVANSVRDLATALGDSFVPKIVLLRDACSVVPGFEEQAEIFLAEMHDKGIQSVSCAEL
jgi:nicotinamidase/pyrazinamidase